MLAHSVVLRERKLHGNQWRRSVYGIVCYRKFLKAIGQRARSLRTGNILGIQNRGKCFVSRNRYLKRSRRPTVN